ncbi:Semaphorin-4E Semaphorin-7 [Collichthys lucidus]|uniref:Semaphorin-4E Semaphorin-7 n=1 Tax=Collichthys lucidus TaxID=240159 RepID=A0A4U5VF47_COLLU|nr:Semaphorin-4E Semaphorin-7 [Collichthys lucidus]
MRRAVLLYFLVILSENLAASNKPRRTVFFQDVNLKLFKESGFDSLSSLMIRDDFGQLVVGARAKVITLSLDDISKKTSEAKWSVSPADKALCIMKGKDTEECDNFIRTLHTMGDGKMLVCGTNAFNPSCDNMNFTNGKISLEGKIEVGRGKVPFEPYQHFASLMDGNTLYSAASSNFLGTELVFQRHGLNPLKTEMKRSWFNEPTMISISLVEVSKNSRDGEDDNLFLFFTENAVEERRDNIQVSRIARVCKSDLGGKRTLQKKWTSFMKARLDCPFGDVGSPCITDELRASGVMTSLNFTDQTLLFAKNHPLMEGSGHTNNRQASADFGWLQKAVKFDGEDGRVIEELQLFQTPQPVNFLQLSSKTGQLYSSGSNVVVQVNVRDCSRYTSCDDCLIARDPYCGWDQIRDQCSSVVGASLGSMIQSWSDGDIRMCPISELKNPAIVHLTIRVAQFLQCSPETNLPIIWRFSGNILLPSARHTVLDQGLIIRPSFSDSGLYTCETVEIVKSKVHRKIVVQYMVQVQDVNTVVRNLWKTVITLAVFAFASLLLFLSTTVIRHLKAKEQNHTDCGTV